MRNVFDRRRRLRRVPIAVLAGLIAVGPGGTVGHTAKGPTTSPSPADDVRQLGPRVEPDQRWLVAPDFTFTVGPSLHSLRDYRGERMVLLVQYTLPESRPRLRDLALGGDALDLQDLEIIFAPTDADPGAIRRLGPEPRLLFPVITGGAADIVQAYQMFARGKPHAEFLLDFQGYVRA